MSEDYYKTLIKDIIENNDKEEAIKIIANNLNKKQISNEKEILANIEKAIEIERLKKALLDIKELVVNNACLSEEYNRCVDDLIYYKCDELLDIVNKALVGDKE